MGPRSPGSSWGTEKFPHPGTDEGLWDVPNAVKKPPGKESILSDIDPI